MTNRELADFLNISHPTLYNWEKHKPNLYKIVMDFKNNTSNTKINQNKEKDELIKLIEQLSEEEKEYYTAVIKADILKKKLNK